MGFKRRKGRKREEVENSGGEKRLEIKLEKKKRRKSEFLEGKLKGKEGKK